MQKLQKNTDKVPPGSCFLQMTECSESEEDGGILKRWKNVNGDERTENDCKQNKAYGNFEWRQR